MLRKFFSRSTEAKSEYYVWSVEGKSVSVHLSLDLVGRLHVLAKEGLNALPRRGLEIGGLLLGRVGTPNSDQTIVSVDEIEVFESEHLRGPSYILSADDKAELFRRIKQHSRRKDGMRVVGFFRSHTRPGLYLDEYDHELFKGSFAHPTSIALLMRPSNESAATAGFFFWESGDIHRASSYKEFPLRTELLLGERKLKVASPSLPATISAAAAGTGAVTASAAAIASAASSVGAESQVLTVPEVSVSVVPPVQKTVHTATSQIPVPAAISPAAHETEGSAASSDTNDVSPRWAQFTAGWRRWAWMPLALAVLMFALMPWYRPFGSGEVQSASPLSLNAEPSGAGLKLTWDRNNAALSPSKGATLWIHDGPAERQISLNESQFRSGTLMYAPSTHDVVFRLQVGDLSESLRAVGAILPQQASLRTAPADPNDGADVDGQANPYAPGASTPQSRSRKGVRVAPPIAVLPGDPEPEKEPQEFRTEELPSPPTVAAAPPRLDEPVTTPKEINRPRSFANVEPAKDNAFKRAVGAIPGLFRGRGKPDEFTPAKAVRQVNPAVPSSVKMSGNTKVSVKVDVDASGRVRGTDLVTRRVDSRLAEAALEAAKRWKFEPARNQAKAVSSSVILHFQFNESGT